MNEHHFAERHQQRWSELGEILDGLERSNQMNTEAVRVPALFRQAATDLSLAQHRMLGGKLCQGLNTLVMRCYQLMNRGAGGRSRLLTFVGQTFPQAVRAEWRICLLGLALFMVPFIGMILSVEESPEWVYSCLSSGEIASLEGMYGDSARSVEEHKDARGVASGFAGFSFYVQHNVSIGLKSYALGALGTLGAVYELIWEGTKLGAMFGYIHYTGNGHKIWQFAVSHSSFELLGLIICATAGIRLGLGLVVPGRLTRGESLTQAAKRSLPLLFGGAGMVFVAAIVEGFWSPQHFIPVEVKFAFGITMWILWLGYFCFAGRRYYAR